MKEKSIYLVVAASFFFLALATDPAAATAPPATGGTLPKINLPVPTDPGHMDYLGLPEKDVFQISEIQAKVVIVEVFSMYCPHCQREAPKINRLYTTIEEDPKYRSMVKLIGIGAGNSTFEVDVFRKTYNVPFPLFADADFAIHECLGGVRTPYFIGVKIDDDGSHEIFYSKLGGFEDPAEFFQQMLKLSGLE